MMNKIKILLMFAIIGYFFSSCSKDDDPVTTVTVPSQLSLSASNFFPEDVVVGDNKVFVSGFGDGSIRYFDLTQNPASAQVFANAETGYTQAWGLAISGDKLVCLLNNANFQDLANSGACKLVEYSIASKSKTNEWVLPAQTVGNSINIINGRYFVGDFGVNPRIIEVNPSNNTINVNWATSSNWPSGGFGIGGMIYNESNAIYATQGGKLWYIPISNNTAGAIQEVTLTGATTQAAADGITWAGNNTLYFANNDAFDPNNAGTVYKVVFSGNTAATTSIQLSNQDDPSGIWFENINNQNYLFVNQSQIGALFGVSTLDSPFNISITKL